MTPLEQTVYRATTDLDFRRALQADPQAAMAAHGLALGEEEWAALMDVWDLLIHQPVIGLDDQAADDTDPRWFGGPSASHAALAGQ